MKNFLRRFSVNQFLLLILEFFFVISFGISCYTLVKYPSSLIYNSFFLLIAFMIISNIFFCIKNDYILNNGQIVIFIIFKIIVLFIPVPFFESSIYKDPLMFIYVLLNFGILFISTLYYFLYHNSYIKSKIFKLNRAVQIRSKQIKQNKIPTYDKLPNNTIIINLDKKKKISDVLFTNISGPYEINENDLKNFTSLKYVIGIKDEKIFCIFLLKPNLLFLKVDQHNYKDIIDLYNIKIANEKDIVGKIFFNLDHKNLVRSVKFDSIYEAKLKIKDIYKIKY